MLTGYFEFLSNFTEEGADFESSTILGDGGLITSYCLNFTES